MNYRILSVELFALIGAYMLVMLPVVSATDVNIFFNGVKQDATTISSGNLVERSITEQHDPSDVTWSNVKVLATMSSASLEHSIKKIYLYKCKKMNPIACVQTSPQVFDSWIDTELSWSDISEQQGAAFYPQVANMLFLVKLEDSGGKVSWVGFWDIIDRPSYNIFNIRHTEVGEIDLDAASIDLVQPIKSFISKFQMIPFSWISKANFKSANKLFGLGASRTEIEQNPPAFQAAQSSNTQVQSIGKDFYFVLSETSSGIAIPVTLNLNPSFTCGNRQCELDLGESSAACCFDCGCQPGQYCDVPDPQNPGTGASCKLNASIAVNITGVEVPEVTNCAGNFQANITVRITNPPSGLPSSLPVQASINGTLISTQCTGGPSIFSCPVPLMPAVRCGSGSFELGPNEMDLTLSYRNGPNTVVESRALPLANIRVSVDCDCQAGFFCDAGEKACRPEGQVSLTVINVTSFITDYSATINNTIKLYARINNPPSDVAVTGSTFVLGNVTFDNNYQQGASGSVTCAHGAGQEYFCQLPFTIQNYNKANRYVIRNNQLTFTVTYSNGGQSVTRDLTTQLSDVTIPPSSCGDGFCNPDESSNTCCLDCGCSGASDYCDTVIGCRNRDNVSLVVDSISPEGLVDCKVPRLLTINTRIVNAPTNTNLNYFYYLQNDEIKAWNLQCEEKFPSLNLGLFTCRLTVPPNENCSLPFFNIGHNKLKLSVTFPNGRNQPITKELVAGFPDVQIVPVYHCGDGLCEASLNENGSVCCIDCPCTSANQYCDFSPSLNANGTCRDKNNIRLVIDSPKSAVVLKSCEVTQVANVKAHVENEPSGMLVENVFGVLGGNNAQNVFCTKETGIIIGGNTTGLSTSFNCSFLIPPKFNCSNGDEDRYSPNALSFLLSYSNGQRGRATQAITSNFSDIIVTQDIRSIYDIIHDAMERIKALSEDTIKIMEELMKMWRECIYTVIITAIVGLVATLALSAYSANAFNVKQQGTFNVKDFSDGVKAGAEVTRTLVTTIKDICDMLSQLYRLDIQMKQMEVEFTKMFTCLEIYQHQIDAGQCDKNPQGCFSSITSCLNFGAIQNAMGAIDTMSASIGNDVNQMTDSWVTAGNALGQLSGGSATLSILYNGGPLMQGNTACNRAASTQYASGIQCAGGNADSLTIRVVAGTGCAFPVVKYGTSGLPNAPNSVDLCVGSSCGNVNLQIDTITAQTSWKFTLYCFSDANQYTSHINDLSSSSTYYKGGLDVTVLVDTDNNCICSASEGAPGTGTPSQGYQQAIAYIQNAVNSIAALQIDFNARQSINSFLQNAMSSVGSNNNLAIQNINNAIVSLRSVQAQIASNVFNSIIINLNSAMGLLGSSTSASQPANSGTGPPIPIA